MDFKYKWKNGAPPNRDQAARDPHLLDESQFVNKQDQEIAEETARKQLGVPAPVQGEDEALLPHGDSQQQ